MEDEETLWIMWDRGGERQLTFNETQWIIDEMVRERGITDPEEYHRRLIEAIERLHTHLSLTSVLVKVKGGTFRMGDTYGGVEGKVWEKHRKRHGKNIQYSGNDSGCGDEEDREKPVHTVNLTYDYWIGTQHVRGHYKNQKSEKLNEIGL